MLIPSWNFYKTFATCDYSLWYWGFCLTDFDSYKEFGDEVENLSDYYHPDLRGFIYYFDSLDHLKSILSDGTSWESIDEKKRVRQLGPIFYEGVRRRSLESWRVALFGEE